LYITDVVAAATVQAALQSDWFKMHLGWEAEAPRVVLNVLPELVSAWAAGNAAAAPAPAAALAPVVKKQRAPATMTVVLDPSSGVPLPVVSPQPVRLGRKATAAVAAAGAGEPVAANNIAPFTHKDGGSSTASGAASAASAADSQRSGAAGPATSSGGARANSKHVTRRAVGARAAQGGDGRRGGSGSRDDRTAQLQPACSCS
jgi:hypothetical protein